MVSVFSFASYSAIFTATSLNSSYCQMSYHFHDIPREVCVSIYDVAVHVVCHIGYPTVRLTIQHITVSHLSMQVLFIRVMSRTAQAGGIP